MRIFITGASGWIGSALIPELIGAGHTPIGLARSEESAVLIRNMGAEVCRGDLDDADILRSAAMNSDGVVHLAFRHELAFRGRLQEALSSNLNAITVFGQALKNTGKPFVVASGVFGLAKGRTATEEDSGPLPEMTNNLLLAERSRAERTVLSLADVGIRSSAVRISPTCHGKGDKGFIAALVNIAKTNKISGYLGNGQTRWPAVHRFDTALLFRLALEKGTPGSVFHAVAEEGIPFHDIASAIGNKLNLAVSAISEEEAESHFGFLADLIGADIPTSSRITQEKLKWLPSHPKLIEDINAGFYFESGAGNE